VQKEYNLLMVAPWILFAAIGGLSSNLFNFLSRYILRKNGGDSSAWAWLYETVRAPLFLILALFNFKLILNLHSALLFFGVGITEFISVYLYMKMHQYSHLSISTILSRTRLVWIPLIAYFTIGENLNLKDYFGILILFLGVSVTVAPHKLFLDKGAIYANLAALVIAVNVIILKEAAPFASPPILLFFYSVPSMILFPIFMRNAKQRLILHSKQNFLPKLIAVLASMGAGYFLILALQSGDVSKVNAIYQGMMVTGVIAGIILLKERKDILRKIVGTVLALAGIFFLT